MKFIKVIALVLAAVLLCMGTVSAACAEDDYYAQQVKKFEEMQARTIKLRIFNNGLIVLKTSKLYARKVTGVAADGSFILGPWQCVDSRSGLCMGAEYTEIPGTCAMFAYSVDILGGTDWPFSGVFWTNVNEPVEYITCETGGGCRTVFVDLQVNQRTVYSESNCSSHTEWRP